MCKINNGRRTRSSNMKINVEADKAGINVSKVLQDALMSVLNVSRG